MKWSIITSAISVASFAVGIRWGAVGVASIGGVGFVLIQTPLIVRAATRTGPVSAKLVINAIMPMVVGLSFSAPVTYLFSKFAHMNPIVELCEGSLLSFTAFLLPIFLTSSGREMLLEATTTLSSYISRLRSLQRRVTA